MDGLVDEGAAAIEGERAAPSRPTVVFRRAVPLDSPRGEDRAADRAGVDHLFQLDDVGLEAVLEEHAELDAGAVGGGDERVGPGRRDVERFLDEDMQPATGRRDALLGVERGRAADGDEIHRAVIEELFQVVVGHAAVAFGEALRLLALRPYTAAISTSGIANAARACVSLMLPAPRMPILVVIVVRCSGLRAQGSGLGLR